MYIGDHIRAARERRGMTQKELAEAVGVAEGTATLWENRKNNRTISGPNLLKVAEVLGSTVAELLGDQSAKRHAAVAQMSPLLVNVQEKAIVMLFRSFPEKLQLLQLAQFVECANQVKVDDLVGEEDSTVQAEIVALEGQAA